jgi:hypothetical protein
VTTGQHVCGQRPGAIDRAVNPRAHKRFLAYLEKLEYFRRPGLQKLPRDEWLVLDTELEGLIVEAKTEERAARIKVLRKQLLRD